VSCNQIYTEIMTYISLPVLAYIKAEFHSLWLWET